MKDRNGGDFQNFFLLDLPSSKPVPKSNSMPDCNLVSNSMLESHSNPVSKSDSMSKLEKTITILDNERFSKVYSRKKMVIP
jgi:hypothetical protein